MTDCATAARTWSERKGIAVRQGSFHWSTLHLSRHSIGWGVARNTAHKKRQTVSCPTLHVISIPHISKFSTASMEYLIYSETRAGVLFILFY